MKYNTRNYWLVIVCLLTLTAQAQLTPVSKGGKYGFQRNGAMVISPQFDYASHFTEGMALVKSGKSWGYIDTVGNWLVQPIYSNATPVHNGFAYVFNNGKRGVIGKIGKLILDAVYDSIIDERSYYLITKGGLRGFANEDFSFTTPIIYSKIDYYYYNYFSCKKPSGKWDIYSQNELVIADVDRPLDRDNFLTNTKIMFLKKGGKYGVWQVGEGWKHEPAYDSIISTPYPYYTVGNNYFREVFLLWNKGTDPDPDAHKQQSFQVMDGGGTILSKETFYDFENPRDKESPLKFMSDEVTLFLFPELKAVHLPYSNVSRHLDWFIATGNGKDHILDNAFLEIAAFDKVEPVMILEPVEFYDEYDNFIQDFQMYPDQTPFLVVSKSEANGSKNALYSLYEKRCVTPYFDSVDYFRSVFDNVTASIGYIYTHADGKDGIFLPGMTVGTDPVFQQVALLSDRKMVCTNPVSGLGQLWDLSGKKEKLLLEEYTIEPSSSVFLTYLYTDSASGELYSTEPFPAFNEQFFICRNEAEKIGVLCFNGARTPCIYDSISQNVHSSNLLNVMIAGRYGLLNLRNAETIAPFSDHPLEPDFNSYRNSWYVTVYETNESGDFTTGYYLDQHGKYVIQSLTDNTRFYKQDGKTGLMAYSEFDEKEWPVIPPLYKKLEFILAEYDYNLLKAKGNNGKWGVLDFKGDTVIPFMFDAIDWEYYESGEMSYLLAKKGKKWALYNQMAVNLIPFGAADSWKELFQRDGSPCMIRFKTGEKYGLVSYDGQLFFPPVYEDVSAAIPFGADQYGRDRIFQFRQGGKWWGLYARISNGYEQTYPNFITPALEMSMDTTNKIGPYDFVIGDWYFKENKPGDYKIDRITFGKETVQETGALPNLTEGDVQFFVENGKIGIRLLEDEETVKTVLAPTFTNVSFYDGSTVLVHDKGESFYYDFITKKRFNVESW